MSAAFVRLRQRAPADTPALIDRPERRFRCIEHEHEPTQAENAALKETLAARERRIRLLEEALRWLKAERYGASRERLARRAEAARAL